MLILLLAGWLPLHAEVVGVSQSAESLTVARVMALPESQRGPWLEYLKRSEAQMTADKKVLAAEREGMTEIPPLPKGAPAARTIPLGRDAGFYKSDEAKHIAATILSYQTPAGGWSKNLNMGGPERLKGQSYAGANLAPVVGGPDDFDKAADENWHYVGTLDNDATNTEIHFLARMSAAWPGREGHAYRVAILHGIEYLLHAQYPNGGWPQVWPLEGGYHDAITYNDDAVTESAEVLGLAARGEKTLVGTRQEQRILAAGESISQSANTPRASEDFSFVPSGMRGRAADAAARALRCILATQVRVGGTLTIWAQQHDPLTLKPVSGRNFEPAALSAGESASVMEYLMGLPKPSAAVVRSVDAAAAWFEAHKIMGYTWGGGRSTPGGRHLTASVGAGPLWARYYSLEAGKPIFGDRDKTIHDDVMELSLERRNGYAWYGSDAAQALTEYAAWKTTH